MIDDPEQDSVCLSPAAYQVVIAPAGTGKTRLAVRLGCAIALDLPPHARVLLLTFSNQARTQLEREAARTDPKLRRRLEITNYHRFFWEAVRAYRRALGLPADVHVVPARRRVAALRAAHPQLVPAGGADESLMETLSEHAFPQFQDGRTPTARDLATLLAVVHLEREAGRVIFDDMGALFWELLERYPSVAAAYRARYPAIIADEHQDASALQDAVIRRLQSQRLVIFADPMQLIHGYRGADPARLDRHRDECHEEHALHTPHRWRDDPPAGAWLTAIRTRLTGGDSAAARPDNVELRWTDPARGLVLAKYETRLAIASAIASGARSVAVLVRWNRQMIDVRDALLRQRVGVRQIGGDELDYADRLIDRLAACVNGQQVAQLALAGLNEYVPQMDATFMDQLNRRLEPAGIRFRGAAARARPFLEALQALYLRGGPAFFPALAALVDCADRAGWHGPRVEAENVLRRTADLIARDDTRDRSSAFLQQVLGATQHATRIEAGVFVMTVHQSKGKEFDAVVLCHATAADFPASDEGRNLFYVALTRGRRRWAITLPGADATPLHRLL